MDKYEQNRTAIQQGDLILFRKTNSPLSRSIQKFDKAYYNHIGLVFSLGTGIDKRNFILDSNAKGVEPALLSDRMEKYHDFCVMRPRSSWRATPEVDAAVHRVSQRAITHIKYDFTLLLEIAVERSLDRKVLNIQNENRDICSEFAYRYAKQLFTTAFDYTKQNWGWISPQDFLRARAKNEFDVLLDSNPGIHLDYDITNNP